MRVEISSTDKNGRSDVLRVDCSGSDELEDLNVYKDFSEVRVETDTGNYIDLSIVLTREEAVLLGKKLISLSLEEPKRG